MSRERRDAILDARGTRHVDELTTMQPPPTIVSGGNPANSGFSVITTETPAISQAGTQFGRNAHGGRG
jgi:hypothetical protein